VEEKARKLGEMMKKVGRLLMDVPQINCGNIRRDGARSMEKLMN
jgi:hypothetical protein